LPFWVLDRIGRVKGNPWAAKEGLENHPKTLFNEH